MMIALHKNARTTLAIRAEIAVSTDTQLHLRSALALVNRPSTSGRLETAFTTLRSPLFKNSLLLKYVKHFYCPFTTCWPLPER
jgi:hypothetical protein